MRLRALALAACLAATGCGGVVTVSQVYSPYGEGSPSDDINYAASLGPIPVVVRGSPFAGDPGNQGIVAALQSHTSIPNLRFVPASSPGNAGYWLVLAFSDFLPGVNYCDGRTDFALSGSSPARIRVAATFCIGNFLRSQALVTGGAATSPADPNFNAMMGGLVSELFR